MTNSELYKHISDRLFKENICSVPLDEKSLMLVAQYMRENQAGSDLMRRLSNIELNYAQIAGETFEACKTAEAAKNSISYTLRKLTDDWRAQGIIRDFAFSFTGDECDYIRQSFISAIESIGIQLRIISDALIILGETAAQIRACSASFTEVYRETRLAIYAAALNRSKEDILDCRAISLEAHASAKECERASGIYLGRARTCTRLIADLNNMISEVMHSLKIDSDIETSVNVISPVKAANSVSGMVIRLENIKLEINE